MTTSSVIFDSKCLPRYRLSRQQKQLAKSMQVCLLQRGENRVILALQTVPDSPLGLFASARAQSLMSPMQRQGPFL